MTLNWKIVIDCADPHAQAAFWAAALGYVVEDNRVLVERLLSAGAISHDAVVTMDDRPVFRRPVRPTSIAHQVVIQAFIRGTFHTA